MTKPPTEHRDMGPGFTHIDSPHCGCCFDTGNERARGPGNSEDVFDCTACGVPPRFWRVVTAARAVIDALPDGPDRYELNAALQGLAG